MVTIDVIRGQLRNLKYLGQPAAELATSALDSWLYNSHTQHYGLELVELFGLELQLWKPDESQFEPGAIASQWWSSRQTASYKNTCEPEKLKAFTIFYDHVPTSRQITLLVKPILDEFFSINTHGELLNLDIHGLLLRCQHSSNDCSLEHLSPARVWTCETKKVQFL